MALDPDPLATNPAVRGWAERFFAIKAWKMDAPVGGAVDVALRRTAATEALGKLVIGADLMPGSRRAFDGGRKALRNAINSADAVDAFNAIDADIVKLGQDITEQSAIAKARALSATALATAEARFAEINATLDQGSFTLLGQRLRDARTKHQTGISKADFTDAEKLAADYLPLCAKAEAYGIIFDKWSAASVAYIDIEITDIADKARCKALRETLMKAATAKSGAGLFPEAEAELAKLALDGSIDSGKLDKAQEFVAKLDEHMAKHAAICAGVVASDLEGAAGFRDHLKSARKKALKDKDYAKGISLLADLEAWCLPRRDLAARMRRFDSASKSMKAFRDAMTEMNKAQKANDFPGAMQKLVDLEKNSALMKVNNSNQVSKKLEPRVKALLALAVLDPVEKGLLQTAWDDHEAAIALAKDAVKNTPNPPDYTEAAKHLKIINDMFRLEKMVDTRAEVAAMDAKYPTAKDYDYLKDYNSAVTARTYIKALTALDLAMPNQRLLAGYLVVKAEADTLLASLPGDPPDVKKGLTDAIASAEVKAKAADPAGAASDLRGFMSGTDYLGLALEISDYTAKLAQVSKRHTAVKKLLGVPAAEKAAEDSLLAAKALATGGDFAGAFLALDAHDSLLTEAQAFGAARRQAIGVQAGLVRAAVKEPALFQDPEKKEVSDRMIEAEKLAAAAKFKEGSVAFQAVLTLCKDLSATAARHYEDEDKKGSNAGHSLDRHGPDATDDALIERLKSGLPPGAKDPSERSYAVASSKFENPQDWLAGRELGAAAALKKGVDIEAKSCGGPAYLDAMSFTVEHGRPIDKAFIGKKKHQKLDTTTNEIVDDKTFETFDEMSGLTRAYVNFIFELTPQTLTDVPLFDKDKKPILEPKVLVTDPDVPVKGSVPVKTVEDYLLHYERKHGGPPVGDLPGHWVMMQQFPLAEGWDDTLKAYTNEPQDMIP